MQPEILPQQQPLPPAPNINSQPNADYDSQNPTPPIHRNGLIRYFQEKGILLPVLIMILIPLVVATLVYKYDIFGLIKKQNYAIEVVDVNTRQPLVNAKVSIRGQTVVTNVHGQAIFKPIKIGDSAITISCLYYHNLQTATLIPFTNHNYHVFGLKGMGTEVHISVINRITQNPIAAANISVDNTSVLTNNNGQAIVNLPSSQLDTAGNIVAKNYNSSSVTINTQKGNSYSLIPLGKTYYINSYAGAVNFLESNLDGSAPRAIKTGGSTASAQNSDSLISPDAKYVAIVMPDGSNTSNLYVYDISTGKVTSVSQSPVGITINGWTSDDTLVFTYDAVGISGDDGSGNSLCAYKATTPAKTYVLDTSTIGGFDSSTFAQQTYNSASVLSDNNVVFTKTWSGDPDSLSSNPTTITTAPVDVDQPFNTPVVQQSLNYANNYQIPPSIIYTSPSTLDMAFKNSQTGQVSYFNYKGGNVNSASSSSVTDVLNKPTSSPEYFLSPTKTMQMWAHVGGNQTTVYTGDKNGLNPKAIATFNNTLFSPYGWWTNNYIILDKSGSALYIMPASGSDNQNKIQEISSFIP